MQEEIFKEICRIQDMGEQAALATVISTQGSTPREEGAKMLIKKDGSITGTIGGGSIENRVIEEAREVIERSCFKKLVYSLKPGEELGMICGGDTEIFLEPITGSPDLFIFGGGHIAFFLSPMAYLAGFNVHVIDSRQEYADPARFPDARSTLVSDYDGACSKLDIKSNSFIVVVTHGHKGDSAALGGALATQARYIGMIGSRNKNAIVFKQLKEKGATSKQLERVHAPIGLAIHAHTPGEIAVSILAEMVQIYRSPNG